MRKEKSKSDRYQNLLILLCWMVYMVAYLGRYSYSANISQIEATFGLNHSTAGLVTMCFFIAYGVGQVVNGFLCRHYPKRWVLSGALLVSAGLNLTIFLGVGFGAYKYLWLVNGAAQSVLWSSLMMIVGENISEKNFKKAVLSMGTTIGAGTLAAYGLSAFLVLLGVYRLVFLIAAILMAAVGVSWFFGYAFVWRRLEETRAEILATKQLVKTEEGSKKGARAGIIAVIFVCIVYAVFNNLIKDGLLTWVPSVLIEKFGLPSSLSILFTIILPVLGMAGTFLIVKLNQVLHHNYFLCACVLFFGVAVLCIGVILSLGGGGYFWIAAILCIGVVNCLMVAVNNMLTTVIPLDLRDRVSSGLLSGIFDGSCYAGSAISSYGIGAVADSMGWTAVFWVFVGVSMFAVVMSLIAWIVKKKQSSRQSQ